MAHLRPSRTGVQSKVVHNYEEYRSLFFVRCAYVTGRGSKAELKQYSLVLSDVSSFYNVCYVLVIVKI